MKSTQSNKPKNSSMKMVGAAAATSQTEQRGREIQKFGTRMPLPIGLPDGVCLASIKALNQTLADTIMLRDLYKKHHWQVAGPTFYQLHLLYDKHYEEQNVLIDTLGERIQILGGISLATAFDVAEASKIEKPPMGREEVNVQLSRLLKAHEQILIDARRIAKSAAEMGDDGTNDVLISDVVRTNELQVWFLAEHLVPESLTLRNTAFTDEVQ